MVLNTLDIRPSATFYKSQKDLDLALTATVEILKSASAYLPKESDGFFPISYICSTLKDKISHLHYINRNHIIEFFFKDLVRKVQFKDETYIKYNTDTEVRPSEILHIGKPTSSLFLNPDDLKIALISTIHLLRDNTSSLNKTKEGYFNSSDVCGAIKKRMPFLDYINHIYLVELFFKDSLRNIIFKDENLIKYKVKTYVNPPDVLYFGTLFNLSEKMKSRGIFSSTKKYIKLYSSKESAEKFAKRFAIHNSDKIYVMEIDARKASEAGIRFSTYEEGEYIVSEVKKEFIK